MEDDDQQEAKPKDGDGASRIGQDGKDVIEGRVLFDSLYNANRQADEQLDHEGDAQQQKRGRDALQHHFQGRTALHVGATKITLQDGKGPFEVTAVERVDVNVHVFPFGPTRRSLCNVEQLDPAAILFRISAVDNGYLCSRPKLVALFGGLTDRAWGFVDEDDIHISDARTPSEIQEGWLPEA